MMVHLRPMKSAMSPAARAPTKVPSDRMETMSDWVEPLSEGLAGSLMRFCGSMIPMKALMPVTPLM